MEITQLRDGMPAYLRALANLLRNDPDNLNGGGGRTWSAIAREHGITRVRIGFDIGQLVHEFVVLRHVIRDVLQELEIWDHGPESVLADLLDGAIAAAVQAYVDARDYQARRRQAQEMAFVTHEFRNPLSAAILSSDQLRRKLPAEQATLLDTIDRNLRKLNQLIDSMLMTQRLEAGEVESRPVEVKLGQVMEGALEAARQVAAQKGLELRVDFDPDLTVMLDPVLTHSAIQNIVDNAAKYTDVGHVEVSVRDLGQEISVDVRDTCAGISEEELRTIFEPFRRGHTKKAGTGLGLAIARRAVEAQGGTIGAESPGDSGCHFSIRLPKPSRKTGGETGGDLPPGADPPHHATPAPTPTPR